MEKSIVKKTAFMGVIIGSAILATTAMAGIKSNIYIEKNDAFLLGGSQPKAFNVRGQNTGPVAVKVMMRPQGKDIKSDVFIATIAPGAKFSQDFAQKQIAVFRNTSNNDTAIVKVRVTGFTKGLGMRYQLPKK